jgi:hypothetical protein
MIPNSDGLCLIARVVDDDRARNLRIECFADLFAVSEGANVSTMSLSGDTYFQAGQEAINWHMQGALSVVWKLQWTLIIR